MSEVKTTYRDIEISYSESRDEWMCDLFSQPADTLAMAKERINKKLDTEKKQPFKRFNAFVKSFGYKHDGSWPLVEVTSVTDDGREAWCSLGGERSKIGNRFSSGNLPIYIFSPENVERVQRIHDLETAIEKANKRIQEETDAMKIWKHQ